MKTKPWAIILVLINTFVTASAQIFWKLGAGNLEFTTLLTNFNLIIGIVLYTIAVVMLIIALKHGELTVLYPVIATSYIWVSILSIKFVGEQMNILKWAGVLVIIIGVSLVVKGSKYGLVDYVEVV